MAKFVKWIKAREDKWYIQLIEAIIYAIMLIIVMICFTGNGQFIYEL